MRTPITYVVSILALIIVAASCALLSSRAPGDGNVYLVGVAGGG